MLKKDTRFIWAKNPFNIYKMNIFKITILKL